MRATGAHERCDVCIADDRREALEDPQTLRSLVIQIGYDIQALAAELQFVHSYAMFDHDRARLKAHTVHLEQIWAHMARRLPPGLGPEDFQLHSAIDLADEDRVGEDEPCPA